MRRFWMLMIVLAGCDVARMPASAQDEVLYDDAKAAYDEGKFLEARDLFDKIWANYPESERHPKAGYLRGRCRYEIADLPGAIETLGEFRAVHPASEWEDDAAYFGGRSRYELTDFDGALPDLVASLAANVINDHADDARYYLGRVRFELAQFEAAAEDLARVETDYPVSVRLDAARYWQGRSWFEAEVFSKAVPPLERVDTGGEYGERAAYRLGRSRYSLADLLDAYGDLDRVLAYPQPQLGDDALYYQVRIQADRDRCNDAEARDAVLRASYPASPRVADSSAYLEDAGCTATF